MTTSSRSLDLSTFDLNSTYPRARPEALPRRQPLPTEAEQQSRFPASGTSPGQLRQRRLREWVRGGAMNESRGVDRSRGAGGLKPPAVLGLLTKGLKRSAARSVVSDFRVIDWPTLITWPWSRESFLKGALSSSARRKNPVVIYFALNWCGKLKSRVFCC